MNDRGGYESDLTALKLDDNEFRLYVGSGAIKRDLAWLNRHLHAGEQVELIDETEDYAVLGLMGPQAASVMTNLASDEIGQLGYFRFCHGQVGGIDVDAVRLSYVGEAGWELTCRSRDAVSLWQTLRDAGVTPAGMFAMTSMRIEKRYLAFGHDLDTDIDPLQAGLEFALDWDSDFVGREALFKRREHEPEQRLVSIVLDNPDAQPLGNEPVYHAGEIIGKTTSAAFGYRVGKPVAIALLNTGNELSLDGLVIDVDIARSQNAGTVSLQAAFDPEGTRLRN